MDSPVDGYLSYASVINMKAGGTWGKEFAVQSAPAVTKEKAGVPLGLLELGRHLHLKVLKYLEPQWVRHGGVADREREGGEEEEEEEGGLCRPSRPALFSVGLSPTLHV